MKWFRNVQAEGFVDKTPVERLGNELMFYEVPPSIVG